MADLDSKPYGIIYCATNKINGKRYVGQTTNTLKRRWSMHCCPGGNCKFLSSAIQKYGKESFEVAVIDSALTLEELNEKELFYIATYGTTDRAIGYNLRPGGNSSTPSESSKKLMAEAKIGRKLSDEHKKKIGASGVGRVTSEETKLKQSAAKKGKKCSEEHIKNLSKPRPDFVMSESHRAAISAASTGCIFSEERRRKISEANKGRVKGPLSDEVKAKLSISLTGKTRTPEQRAKMSAARLAGIAARKAAQI